MDRRQRRYTVSTQCPCGRQKMTWPRLTLKPLRLFTRTWIITIKIGGFSPSSVLILLSIMDVYHTRSRDGLRYRDRFLDHRIYPSVFPWVGT